MVLKRYLNVNELTFDIVVALIVFFGIDFLLPGGRRFVELYSPGQILVIALLSAFFVMLFLGDIYRRYINTTGSGVLIAFIKIVFFCAISSIYLVVLTFFTSHHVMPFSLAGIRELEMVVFLMPVYPVIWGVTLSFPPDEIDSVKYTLYIPGMMAVALIPVTALMAGYYISWFLVLPVLVVLILLLAGPYYLKQRLMKKRSDEFFRRFHAELREEKPVTQKDIERIKNNISGEYDSRAVKFFLSSWHVVLFPVFCATALILWQKMTVEMLLQAWANWHVEPDLNTIFWILAVSGIVPVRILAEIAPPWKPVNTLVASGALLYYIVYLYTGFH